MSDTSASYCYHADADTLLGFIPLIQHQHHVLFVKERGDALLSVYSYISHCNMS